MKRKASNLFPELRYLLARNDIDLPYLASLLGVTERSIRLKLRNIERSTWRLEEMYQIMDILHEPPERLPILFPHYDTERRVAK